MYSLHIFDNKIEVLKNSFMYLCFKHLERQKSNLYMLIYKIGQLMCHQNFKQMWLVTNRKSSVKTECSFKIHIKNIFQALKSHPRAGLATLFLRYLLVRHMNQLLSPFEREAVLFSRERLPFRVSPLPETITSRTHGAPSLHHARHRRLTRPPLPLGRAAWRASLG